MLVERHRLRQERDFKYLWRRGRETRVSGLRIRTARSCNTYARVGIVVSKKISKQATTRNRLRRMIREALRPLLPSLCGRTDYLFVATPGFKPKSSTTIREHLIVHLSERKLLRI